MGELKDILDRMAGRTKPSQHKIVFIVSNFDEPKIIAGENIDWILEDISTELEWVIDSTERNKIPTEIGAYSAELTIHSFRSNNFDDPEEWDMTIKIDKIERIEISYK